MTSITARLIIGIVIAIADFFYSSRKCRENQGDAYYKKVLQSIEVVLDGHSKGGETYNDAVETVKTHLIRLGIVRIDAGFLTRVKHAFSKLSCREYINNLSLPALLAFAACLELVFDFLVSIRLFSGEEGGLLSLLLDDLYQIPVLFVGLLLGRIIKDVWVFAYENGEQKKMEETIRSCINNTELLKLVMANESNNNNIDQSQHYGVKLTKLGVKAYDAFNTAKASMGEAAREFADTAKDVVDDIVNYQKEKQEQIYKKQAQEKEQNAKRFDDITKGR
jgi:hypothetical protein